MFLAPILTTTASVIFALLLIRHSGVAPAGSHVMAALKRQGIEGTEGARNECLLTRNEFLAPSRACRWT